jgi:hypothetical protein
MKRVRLLENLTRFLVIFSTKIFKNVIRKLAERYKFG